MKKETKAVAAEEAGLQAAEEALAAAKKEAANLPALEKAVEDKKAALAKAKEEAAAQPSKAERHPLVWLPLAIVSAAVIVATAMVFRPLPDPIPVTVLMPTPPPAAVVIPPPAVTPPPATRPVARPPAVVPPPPAAPAPVVPPAVATPPAVVPSPVVAPVIPPVVAAAPEMGFAVNLFSIREEIRAGEHWLLVRFHFSGDTRGVREWTIRVGGEQLPWGPFVPGSYEVRLPRPVGATTLLPLARLASGQEVAGEPITWTPSR